MKAHYVIFASCLILLSCAVRAERPNFDKLTERLNAERQVNAVIVSQNGKITYEYHLTEGDEDRAYNYYSVAKSVTAIIAGIAIDKGYIESEDVHIADYFPQIREADALKREIRLRHLLSMTSGISWPESTEWNHFFRPMMESDNWIDFILARDMSGRPGAAFNYNSGNPHLVSRIIQDATKKNMFDFGKDNLFDKLGMDSVSWYYDPQGVCFGGAWISMKPKDALKIGQLILDGGYYGNRRIVSTEWVNKMTSIQSGGERTVYLRHPEPETRRGVQWHLRESKSDQAAIPLLRLHRKGIDR